MAAPTLNANFNELMKCTLCPYRAHVKSTFQRHLMKSHGIKLKDLEEGTTGEYSTLGRIINDYTLGEKFEPQEVFTNKCNLCSKLFSQHKSLKLHRQLCRKTRSKLNAKLKRKGLSKDAYSCETCHTTFANAKYLTRHQALCGKKKDLCCQLCPYKSFAMDKLSRHMIDKHNLIPKPVVEPDFDEALDGTPYTLERAAVFDALPGLKEMTDLWNSGWFGSRSEVPDQSTFAKELKILPGKHKTLACPGCMQDFSRIRHLNRHMKLKKCGI